MKTIKNGLIALAFSFNSGCLYIPEVETYNSPRYEEFFYFQVNIHDGQYRCTEALVRMNPKGYSIECDWNHRFRGTPLFNALYWDDAAWYDENKDDRVDTFMSNGEYYDASNLPGVTGSYQGLLEDLNQGAIDSCWFERWR